jgi:hypothetical protein
VHDIAQIVESRLVPQGRLSEVKATLRGVLRYEVPWESGSRMKVKRARKLSIIDRLYLPSIFTGSC